GQLECAADRTVQEVASDDVEEREHHQAEKRKGGSDAEHGIDLPFPLVRRGARQNKKGAVSTAPNSRGIRRYLPALSFFSSWWNSSSACLAFGTFADAFFTQSSMMGPARFFDSACIAALAVTMFAPAFFSSSSPTLSARSHDCPFERAAYS